MKFLAKRLDANAYKGRQRAGGHPLRNFLGSRGGMAVLLRIGTDTIAVLKINAKILYGLARDFFADTSKDRIRQFRRQIEGFGKGRRIRRKSLERPHRKLAKPHGGV